MKKNYLDRAMSARDPRFRKIAEKLGHKARIPAAPKENIDDVRAAYQIALGKRPFHAWDIETLKAKIAEAEK